MDRAYDLVIFDLDGTLCDTAPDIGRCLNRAMREFDLPEVTHDRILAAIGPGGKAFYRAIMPEEFVARGESEYMPLAERIVERYRSYYNVENTVLTKPFPGVRELLDRLRDDGVMLSVASNKPESQVRSIVAKLDLNPYFCDVLGPESVEHPKPAPDMLRHAMRSAGVQPDRTLMVGDTDNDMASGRAAGATTAFVTWGYRTLAEIDPDTVDVVVETADEIPAIVAGRAAPTSKNAR